MNFSKGNYTFIRFIFQAIVISSELNINLEWEYIVQICKVYEGIVKSKLNYIISKYYISLFWILYFPNIILPKYFLT